MSIFKLPTHFHHTLAGLLNNYSLISLLLFVTFYLVIRMQHIYRVSPFVCNDSEIKPSLWRVTYLWIMNIWFISLFLLLYKKLKHTVINLINKAGGVRHNHSTFWSWRRHANHLTKSLNCQPSCLRSTTCMREYHTPPSLSKILWPHHHNKLSLINTPRQPGYINIVPL